MTDPTITKLDPADPNLDAYYIQDNLTHGSKQVTERIPTVYRDAVVTNPAIREWVSELVNSAKQSTTPNPRITTGRSLLVLGPIGVGKTFEACGAIRALSASGAHCDWELLTAADVYARLRPRPRIDSEEEFRHIADATLLILDDLGAAKATEWTEDINYRLINHRCQWRKPTIITSNVLPEQLGATIGQRVASRLIGMTTQIVMTGPDRRLIKMMP